MIRAEETRLIEGFIVGRDRIRVFLLQFADDTIFFSKVSPEHSFIRLKGHQGTKQSWSLRRKAHLRRGL